MTPYVKQSDSSRQGTFDGYSVTGVLFVGDELHHAWRIFLHPNDVGFPHNDYMVDKGRFLVVHDGGNVIQVLGEAEVEPAEKSAVLKAIAKWEEVGREKLLADLEA